MSEDFCAARPLGAPTGPREDYKPAPEPFRRDTSVKPEKVEIVKHSGHMDRSFKSPVLEVPVIKRYTVSSLDEIFPPVPPPPNPTDESRLKAAMQDNHSDFETDKTSKIRESMMHHEKAVKAVQGVTIVDQILDAVRSGCHTIIDIQKMTLLERDRIHSTVSKLVKSKRLVDKRKDQSEPRYLEVPNVERNTVGAIKKIDEVSPKVSPKASPEVAINPASPPENLTQKEMESDKTENSVTDVTLEKSTHHELSSVDEKLLRIQQLHDKAESSIATLWESFNELESLAKNGAEAYGQLERLNDLIHKFNQS